MKLFTGLLVSKRTRTILIFIVTTLVISSSFYKNSWKMIDSKFYQQWRDVFDEFVIGRLAKSNVDGVLSAGGLLLIGNTDHYDLTSRTIRHQTDMYYQKGKFDIYWTYKSTSGLEGLVFSLFDKVTDFEPSTNVRLFYLGTALVSGAVLSLILLWILSEFGFAAYFLAAVSVAFSPWLQLMGGSLYWQLWSLYLPFGLVLFTITYFNRQGTYLHGTMRVIVFLGVLIKVLFTGFEFITTALISVTVPFVYFMIRDHWYRNLFIKRLIDTMIFGGLATLVGLLILLIQISFETGGYAGAYSYIVDALSRRAVGNPAEYSGLIAESLGANRLQVLGTYLFGPAYGMGGGFTGGGNENSISHLLIIIVFIISGVILLRVMTNSNQLTQERKAVALLATTWYSILAPLSWLVIFKAHAYIHVNLDYFVWQLPFLIFGFALVGYSVSTWFTHRNGHTSSGT